MAKEFLNKKQVKELEKKNWEVKPKCFHNTFYKDETESDVWGNLCKIAGADTESESVTLLSVGFIEE